MDTEYFVLTEGLEWRDAHNNVTIDLSQVHTSRIQKGYQVIRLNEKLWRFDPGKPHLSGHAKRDHWHQINPNYPEDPREYLDEMSTPCLRGSECSHIYKEE